MTAKDLHFSFDDAKIPRQPAATRQASAAPRRASPTLTLKKTARSARQHPPKSAKATKPGGQWRVTAGIALANMAFLLLAGLWVTGNTYHIGDVAAAPAPEINAALAPALVALREGVVDSSQALGQELDLQLQEVRSALQQQSQVLAALQAEISQLRTQLAPATTSAVSRAPAATDWHINLGSFPGNEDALALQQQMKALGHTAAVSKEVVAGVTNYLVRVPGFADRAAADIAAKRIMEQTSLNGLWVWNGE